MGQCPQLGRLIKSKLALPQEPSPGCAHGCRVALQVDVYPFRDFMFCSYIYTVMISQCLAKLGSGRHPHMKYAAVAVSEFFDDPAETGAFLPVDIILSQKALVEVIRVT